MRLVVLVAAMLAACSAGKSDTNNGNTTPSLTVTPMEWSVPAGGASKQFTATLTGAKDPIAWAIETAGTASEVGTISAGLYAPPPSLASGRDVVVKATAGALVARATVHVGAGIGGVTLMVTPATGAVTAGSAQTVSLHADTSYVGTIAWAMSPAVGTLDPATGATVTYTAPSAFVMWDTDVVVTATAGALSDTSTITVHPTALAVTGPTFVHAGDAPVAFTLETDVAGNPVAWSLVPASVGSITGTGSTGAFTPAASVGSATPFQVIATVGGASGHASATLLPPASPMMISGTVTDHVGNPFVGAKVVIGSQSTTSGVGGAFSISSVVPPYDATLITDNSTFVTVFRGVSSTTPVLAFAHFDPYQAATVTGKVTFAGGLGAQGATLFSPALSMAVYDPDGVYTFQTAWFGTSPANVTHRAWAIGDMPSTVGPDPVYYGARNVALTAGGTTTGQDIVLAQLASGHVTGDAGLAADFVFGTDLSNFVFTMSAHFDDRTSRTVYDDTTTYGPFDFVVPAFPDGSVRFSYDTWSTTSGRSAKAYVPVVAGQTGVALVIPSTPTASAPASGATGVGYATALTWTTTNVGGMNGVSVDCDNGMSYRIIGGDRSANIPDLRAYGISPGTATCTWSPTWSSLTVDAEVQGPVALDALPKRSSAGASRSFTFTP